MENFLLYLLQSALCFTVLFLPFQWLLRKGELIRLNRVIILLTISLCFVFPLIYHEMPGFMERLISLGNDPASEDEIKVIGYANYSDGIIHKIETETTSLWTIQNILLMIWLIGAVVVLVWHIFSYTHLYKTISTCKSSKMKLDNGASVYLFKDEVPSMSWMNLVMMSEQDYKENKAILMHELAHVKCGHSWDRLFMSMCLIVQWFNPLVWICSDTLNEIHEYEADREVLHQGIDMTQYQYLLVSKAAGQSTLAMVNGFNHSQLKSRIKMMKNQEHSLWSKVRYLILMPMLFLAFVVSANAAKQETPVLTVKVEEDVSSAQGVEWDVPTTRVVIRSSGVSVDNPDLKPLTIVDDEVVEDINSIDMSTIESVEVIKSGSVFAMPYEEKYEAAREVGIILIKTKKQ